MSNLLEEAINSANGKQAAELTRQLHKNAVHHGSL